MLTIILMVYIFLINTTRQDTPLPLYKLSELNESCKNDKDCRNFGYVCQKNKTCQCDTWYIPNNVNKKCVGGVNQKCRYDEHCIEGAYCMNQSICKCKEESPIELDDGLVCGASTKLRSHFKLLSILIVLIKNLLY